MGNQLIYYILYVILSMYILCYKRYLAYIKILLKMYFTVLFPAICNTDIQFVQQNVSLKQIKYVTFELLKKLSNCFKYLRVTVKY